MAYDVTATDKNVKT